MKEAQNQPSCLGAVSSRFIYFITNETDRIVESAWSNFEEAKRMYSEEEVKKLIINFLFERGIGREVENVEKWFEQFKKK